LRSGKGVACTDSEKSPPTAGEHKSPHHPARPRVHDAQVSELIHKSAEYPELDMCRVSVYFQDIVDDGSEDAYTVVPDSQFIVTRTAHRNNSSKYYLNASPSSFSEVTTLLRGRGIDLDNNRFLILQGEVEQISMMKPKAPSPGEDGLLEYLEDIIGVRDYVDRIEEAEKVVEALSGERAEKLNRVKVVEKERAALESAKIEAEGFLRESWRLVRLWWRRLPRYKRFLHLPPPSHIPARRQGA